ncbi:MAG TPA: SigB/SigF/SigG family RNA polymerase sigma factor [Firmicutes bacterium]|nr:SigB/SigF/SigG family RNA polymerase sigma factor [Bacillota bacterium]
MAGEARSLRFPEAEILSHEEFLSLLERARSGDLEARDRIVKSNLKLVMSIASRFQDAGEDLDEMFQAGCLGLLKAIDRFDPAFDVKFSTYAVPVILGEIRRHLRDYQPLKVARSLRTLAVRVHQKRAELVTQLGYEPSIGELASALGKSPEEIARALEAASPPISLFDEMDEGDGDRSIRLIDQISEPDDDDVCGQLESLALREAIRQLPERERRILVLRYFRDLSQEQVSRLLGLSQAQVCRIEKKALKTIRQELA